MGVVNLFQSPLSISNSQFLLHNGQVKGRCSGDVLCRFSLIFSHSAISTCALGTLQGCVGREMMLLSVSPRL